MNPQQEIHWKPPAELLLKERSDTAVRNPSAELYRLCFLLSLETHMGDAGLKPDVSQFRKSFKYT